MDSIEWRSDSPESTRQFGATLASICEGGEIFFLNGDLGAGKTCLTQGLAKGLGIDTPVTSPTFVLHCQYPGRLELNHYDAYRLDGSGNLAGLGLDDLFGARGSVAVVEWPEMLAADVPSDYMEVEIRVDSPESRIFCLKAHGVGHRRFMSRLAEILGVAA